MPAPTVGSAKNGIRPTNSKASAVIPSAPAMRTNSLAIGLIRSADTTTPAIDQAYEKPPSCPQHHHLNTQPGAEFHHRVVMLGLRPVQSQPCDAARWRNKEGARHLSWADGHPFPLPRAWPFNVGRSRYADRLRPNLF